MPTLALAPWQLTEDNRYWRVVEEADYRRKSALYGKPAELYSWHSISCVCPDCLDTDTVIYAYDCTDQIDMTGIE